ncbi:MAG: M48 family metallopeptidase [Candidatus Thermoplasmatota archaeon]|nr:M48 family metallopeptidase [Candidatus Thermoplasmatota archaeon]
MTWETIEIIRSKKRKKTIQAKIVDNVLRIYLPEDLSRKQEEEWIQKLKQKMEKKQRKIKLNSTNELQKRAEFINEQYFNGTLDFTIQFVTNQTRKHGSCTPLSKSIRISDEIAKYPQYVQDYLIMHELTHIIHPNHSKAFWKKVNEYPYVERAKGFLHASEFFSKD